MPFVFCNTLENLAFCLRGKDNLNDFVYPSLSRNNAIRLTLRAALLFVVFPLISELNLLFDILTSTKIEINIQIDNFKIPICLFCCKL
jgi:hypothetical protein